MSNKLIADIYIFNLQLSFDLLELWLQRNPDIVGLKKDGISVFKELALFQDYHGLPAFKNVRHMFSDEAKN